MLGMGRLAGDDLQKPLFGDIIGFAQMLRDAEGKQFLHGREFSAVEALEGSTVLFADGNEAIQIVIGHIEAALAAVRRVNLKVGDDLFEGNLKGIADIVEEGGQSPGFQEKGCRSGILRSAGQMIEVAEGFAEGWVHIKDRQAQGKDVDRV